MADRTPFADLTRLAAGDPLSADGYGLQTRNPTLLDYYMRLLFTGKHDGHAKLTDPATAPTLTVDDAGGQIPADQAITVGYTLTDADGGETALSPLGVIETQPGLTAPDVGPILALDHVSGTLLAGSYDYAVTVTDGLGGETSLTPINTLLVPTGAANNRILVTGLDALLAQPGAAGWRLWRSINDEDWHLIGQGAEADFTDDGSHAADCGVSPPQFDTETLATSVLHVTVPGGQHARTVSYSIYASLTGAFDQPSLLGTYPVAEINTDKAFDTLTFLGSTPPEVSTAMAGLPKITAAELASGAGGGGGGGGGTGPLAIRLPWYMQAPEVSGATPSAADSFLWEENGVPRMAIYAEWSTPGDNYAFEAYNGELDLTKLDGDTTHFHLDGSDNVTLVDAGDWQVSVAPDYSVGNWLEDQRGGYVEWDYTIVNDGWNTISAELQSSGTPGAGVRAVIDRVAGTFSLIDMATSDVIASVGVAEGYTPPVAGQSGSMVLALHYGRCVAYDSQDDGSNYVAGPGIIDVTLDLATIAVNQTFGAWGINATDPTAVVGDYWSFGESPLSRTLHVGMFNAFGTTPGTYLENDTVVYTDSLSGGGLRPMAWQVLSDQGAPAPYPAANGWTNPVTTGADWLAWRKVEAADELQIKGRIDGTAATDPVFAVLPDSLYLGGTGDTEHAAVLIAGDGTRSTCYIQVGADRSLSLLQPATPLPAGSTILFNLTRPIQN